MGGKSETKMNGLRLHISGGEVHVHDDNKGLKFRMNASLFKQEVNEALENLKGTDGINKIEGTSASLCLVQDGRQFYMFLTDNKSTKTSLQSFLRDC